MADGSVIIEAILDTANVPKQIGKLKDTIKGVSWSDITKGTDSAKALSSAFKSTGATCTAMFTAPIMAAGTAMVTMGYSFEDAMAKVSTIADTTAVPLDELQSQILDLSDQTGIAAADIADNVYNAISAGQSTGDAVNFVAKAAQLATAGFTDSASALDILSTAMNAYGLEANQVDMVSNTLIKTQNLGKTTVGELAANMGKVIPTAKANGVSMQNLSAMYAVMTSNGIATAETTTYLNSMLNELGKQGTSAADAFAKGTEHIKEGGLTMQEAMDMGWELTDVLSILDEQASESGTSISNMFGSAEAGKAANVLWDNATKLNDVVDQMGDNADVTSEAYQKMQTTTFSLNKAVNQLKNVMVELGGTIGQALQPAIDGFVKGVQGFSDWFKSIGPDGQRAILTIAGVVAAIGPLLTVIGHAIAFVPQLTAGMTALKGIMSGVAGGSGALGGALGALTGPVGIVIGVIAALTAAFVYLWNTDEGFRESVLAAWDQIKTAVSSAIEAAMPYIEQVVEFFTGTVMPLVAEVLTTVLDAFAQVVKVVSSVMPDILGTISSVLGLIQGVFDTVVGFIVGLVTGDFTQMQHGIDSIMSGIHGIFSGVWGTIRGIVSGAVDAIGSALGFPGLGDTVRGVFDGVQRFIEDPIGAARDFVEGIPGEIVGFFSGIGDRISEAIGSIHFPTPHVSWESLSVFGMQTPISLPHVEWYAKGGVFPANDPRLVGMGDAAEPEAAAPISTLKEYVREAVREAGGSGGVTVTVSIGRFVNNTDSDIDDLIERIERKVSRTMQGRMQVA